MWQFFSPKRALNSLLILNSGVIVFHLLVLFKVIPYGIVWAGKLNSDQEMYAFETISILINVLFIFTLLLKGEYIKNRILPIVLNGIIILYALLFSLNTVGNLFASSKLELYLFIPLTFIAAVLCFRIVIHRKINPSAK